MSNPQPIAYDSGFRPRLGVGIALSVFAHVGFGIALAGGWWSGFSDLAPVVGALPPPRPEEPVVRPGIAQSRTVTINWLGFEAPTEHAAAPADTDQAALSPEAPGAPGLPSGAASGAPAASPQPAAQPEHALGPAPEVGAAVDPLPSPDPAPHAEPAVSEALPEAVAPPPDPAPIRPEEAEPISIPEREGPGLAAPLLEFVKRALEAAARPAAGGPAESPASTPPDLAASAESPPAPAAAPGGSPAAAPDALPSEKQSAPTSSDEPIDWAPGRPAAAEGLDIVTVDPRWTIATRLSALPRNPVVRIDFGKDGHVRKAEFLPEQNTGYRDVDGPLLDALYRWSAKGKALDQLPADQPDSVVSLKFRIILVPSRGTVHRPARGR
ncbi:MAG TPA: hypothetical protein VFF69_10760 [Phycisphaerales bacterium]|nr:hypothetical protein [Phycisphaerales bacterium]